MMVRRVWDVGLAWVVLSLFPAMGCFSTSDSGNDPALAGSTNTKTSSDGDTATRATTQVSDARAATASCRLADGRRIQAGAAYSAGCNCCVCTSSGRSACQAAECAGDDDADLVACRSDDDCTAHGRRFCVFDPGCSSPLGTCIGGSGICPTFEVSDLAPFEYCGCDGATYSTGGGETRQYPYKPYLHYGACP